MNDKAKSIIAKTCVIASYIASIGVFLFFLILGLTSDDSGFAISLIIALYLIVGGIIQAGSLVFGIISLVFYNSKMENKNKRYFYIISIVLPFILYGAGILTLILIGN